MDFLGIQLKTWMWVVLVIIIFILVEGGGHQLFVAIQWIFHMIYILAAALLKGLKALES
jgi:hypothetical protein